MYFLERSLYNFVQIPKQLLTLTYILQTNKAPSSTFAFDHQHPVLVDIFTVAVVL